MYIYVKYKQNDHFFLLKWAKRGRIRKRMIFSESHNSKVIYGRKYTLFD
jgi:hypothetical protein